MKVRSKLVQTAGATAALGRQRTLAFSAICSILPTTTPTSTSIPIPISLFHSHSHSHSHSLTTSSSHFDPPPSHSHSRLPTHPRAPPAIRTRTAHPHPRAPQRPPFLTYRLVCTAAYGATSSGHPCVCVRRPKQREKKKSCGSAGRRTIPSPRIECLGTEMWRTVLPDATAPKTCSRGCDDSTAPPAEIRGAGGDGISDGEGAGPEGLHVILQIGGLVLRTAPRKGSQLTWGGGKGPSLPNGIFQTHPDLCQRIVHLQMPSVEGDPGGPRGKELRANVFEGEGGGDVSVHALPL